MTIKILFNPMSQHARRTKMAAIELGLDLEYQLVDFMKGEHQAPDYLARNPNGKVPTLIDGDFVLWESNAILCYLADQKPASGLYPTELKARADVNRWLFWEAAHFGPAALTLTWERVMKPNFMKQAPEPVLVAQGEENWKRFAAVLDRQLAAREYVTGKLSLADLSLASVLTYHEPAGIDLKSFTNLSRWFAKMEARDSWKQTKG